MATLQEIAETSREMDTHKQDYIANSKDINFDDVTARLRVPPTLFGEVIPLELTDWALSQFCTKTGVLPAPYMQRCPSWLQAVNLNHWGHGMAKDLMIRGYDDTCRAVLSAQYSPIWNTVVLEKAADIMGDIPYYESHYLDQNTFHGKFTVANRDLGDDNPGGFGAGFYLGNGETGNRAVRVAPYMQRNACQNSVVFLDWGIEIRHYRTTPAFIFGAIKETIGKAIGLSMQAIERFVEAENTAIPDVANVLDDLAQKYNLSLPIKEAMIFGTEGKATLAGIINGISFAAQKIEDYDQRVDMECLAGAILLEPSVLKRRTPIVLQAGDEVLADDNEQYDLRERNHTFLR
jgi:hypothetical protein